MPIAHIDLTQRPPRSARVRLGGYCILPRMLDKGRAVAGKDNGYKYACPLDQEFLNFAGVDPAKIRKELEAGKGDGEILDWITANAANKRTQAEIIAWSNFQDERGPGEVEKREFFGEIHKSVAPHRNDIISWFDLLDLDDFASYGGKP